MTTHTQSQRSGEAGFTLVETLVAMGILTAGLLSLLGVFVLGLNHLAGSSVNLIAREKAREAVESVHTARDTRVITWCQIYNVNSLRHPNCVAAPAGVFKAGPQPLQNPGPDGLINTADDVGTESSINPGPDGTLGTADDRTTPLTGFTREVIISELLTNGVPNPTLRQIRVVVRYQVAGVQRIYTLTTYISSIS